LNSPGKRRSADGKGSLFEKRPSFVRPPSFLSLSLRDSLSSLPFFLALSQRLSSLPFFLSPLSRFSLSRLSFLHRLKRRKGAALSGDTAVSRLSLSCLSLSEK